MTLRSLLAAFVLAAASVALPAAAKPITHLANGIEASNGVARTEVTAITDSILRVRIARGGKFGEDASWAVPAARR